MTSTIGSDRSQQVDTLLVAFEEDPGRSFDELYQIYKPSLTRFAARQNASDPEGVADLALFDGYRAISQLRSRTESSFRSYLFRSASRYVSRERRRPAAEPIEVDDHNLAAVDGFETTLATSLDLQEVLAELPPDQYAVMKHRFVDDLTGEQTAELLGKSANAVHQLQFRATRRLQRVLIAAALLVLAALAIATLFSQSDRLIVDSAPAENTDDAETVEPDDTETLEPNTTIKSQVTNLTGRTETPTLESALENSSAIEPQAPQPLAATETSQITPTSADQAAAPSTTTATQTSTNPSVDVTVEVETTLVATTQPTTIIESTILVIANDDIVTGTVGQALNVDVTRNDDPGSAFYESVERVSGSMPGLTLTSTGQLTGIPTQAGQGTIVYRLISHSGSTAIGRVEITIEPS